MSKQNVVKFFAVGLTGTGRVCESPLFNMVVGTYTGEVAYALPSQNRSCRWSTTVNITGTNAGTECTLTGSVSNVLIEQGTQFESRPYSCDFGSRAASFAFGLGVGDDLNSIRPVSVIAYFEPGLEERDINGQEMVYPVTQSRSLDIERDRRSGASVIQLDANILTKQ